MVTMVVIIRIIYTTKMKVTAIISLVICTSFFRCNSPKQFVQASTIKTILDTSKVRLNGVYSLYDTSKGNDEIEAYKRYPYIQPIALLDNGYFIKVPSIVTDSISLLKALNSGRKDLDYGQYQIIGNKIALEGMFTFFARGMDLKQSEAKYIGYFDDTCDTLFLKLGEPYPKLNMKFNKKLDERIKNGSFQKYVFKPLH